MIKLSRTGRPWLWSMVLLLALVVIFLSAVFQNLTGEHTKVVIQEIMDMTEDHAYLVNAIARKTAHILIYGLLGVLFYIVIRQRSIGYAWFSASLIAVLDEWHQAFVPDRTPLFQDVILDSLAALSFLMIFAYLRRRCN